MAGLSRCAAIAAHYNQTEVFDHIFESLSRITQLKEYSPIDNETRKRQSNNLANKKLDKWVVDFGKNYRRRIAAVLMFCLASQYGGYMRSGWKDVSLVWV